MSRQMVHAPTSPTPTERVTADAGGGGLAVTAWQACLWPPCFQCTFWHAAEQYAVLWHRAQRCNPGLAHPSLAHGGSESIQLFQQIARRCAQARQAMVVVTRVRAVEGCEKKSQHTSKVFGRGLIGVMNEGVGQTATGVAACMLATGLHDSSACCATAESACAFWMGETRRRIGVARCPQRVGWSDAPCPSSQTGWVIKSRESDGIVTALNCDLGTGCECTAARRYLVPWRFCL